MWFYVGEKEEERRVCVSLTDKGHEVEVLLNGIPHMCLSVDGDLMMHRIADSNKVPGVKYDDNELTIWRG